jgi:hypothetical protein
MLTLIEIDGKLFHASEKYDQNTGEFIGEEVLLDENGNMIPARICLCFAHEPSECCCATTSWSKYRDEF